MGYILNINCIDYYIAIRYKGHKVLIGYVLLIVYGLSTYRVRTGYLQGM